MFGFLAPQQKIPRWRQSYARICQHQRLLFGLTSLPLLSYEATFLYQLAIDFELIAELPDDAPQCCRLRKLKTLENDVEAHSNFGAASFASAFGMSLVGVKLDDDVQDSGRWFNRLARWKYRKGVRLANELLDGFSHGLPSRIEKVVQDHALLETQDDVPLDDYCTPTADGFSDVFLSFAQMHKSLSADCLSKFAAIGRHIGAAIIAWDCAVDFEKDQVQGEFNPLSNLQDVRRSFDHCLLQLSQIGWLLPEGSTSAQVIASVCERVRCRRNANVQHPVKTLERWGLVRQKGRAYARCDGCDALCMVGDCCECLGGAGEAAGGCAECGVGNGCGFPCIDGFLCCGDCSGCDQKKKPEAQSTNQNSDKPSVFAKYHGKDAIVDDGLNPSGFVLIDAERVVATSASGKLMEAGTRCKVVRTDAFGVTVKPT